MSLKIHVCGHYSAQEIADACKFLSFPFHYATLQYYKLYRTHLFENRDDRHDRFGRSDNRIQNVGDIRPALTPRQAVEVLDGGDMDSRSPVHSDVVNGRVWKELEHGFGHSEAAAEDWHQGDPIKKLDAAILRAPKVLLVGLGFLPEGNGHRQAFLDFKILGRLVS